MADPHSKYPRSREIDQSDEGIGGIVDEIASSWIVGDALTRLVDTGEKVVRAQQSALSALGLPSGSQFESLTLRVRTLFHRIEELEDDIDRLDARVAKLEAAAKSAPAASNKPAVKRAAPRRATSKKAAAKKPAAKRASS